ncbi:MAG: PmeII family type II restriction endonuclease [Verrucomicrobiae bacterium]|nr:PmeII family type II restriction endonuclease [Verrucomicrobiae bacterium]
MHPISAEEIARYVEDHIPQFHQRRLESLSRLQLRRVLKRKNPYLFKAKHITVAGDLVKGILDAHLSSQEETLFGGFLEGLAVFVCQKAFGGRKSSAEGVDLEFERDGVWYLVSIKSGPNWGNSGQIKKMVQNFRKAKQILRRNAPARNVIAVNGCCYGTESAEDKGDYLKKCGQSFWSFISGDENLYTAMIEPLGCRAKERNEAFQREYAKVINRFTEQFIREFCRDDKSIDWEKLVRFVSGREQTSDAQNGALNAP